MSASEAPTFGAIAWADLTVPDAIKVRDFYKAVLGWDASPVPMGNYNDFQMNLHGTDQAVAGICHARGVNADLPAQWLLYVTVTDMDASIHACTTNGGAVISGPRDMGAYGQLCVIRDPAGAVMALMQPPRVTATVPRKEKE